MTIHKLGRYEIISELGQGAMGVVYKAKDPLLDRIVAIKTINLSLSMEELAEYEARFYQEAKAAGRLNHPNIVTIHDVGKSEDVAYMAMEYLEGRELRDMLTPGTVLPVEQAIDIAAQVAEGLAYAHENHIVHRDIKPANIMIVRDGVVKITDFGIARTRSAEVRTQTGIVLGSPKYMSPEQVVGKRVDQRSDIFSLGVVLYEMLAGSAPFAGADIHAIMFQILNLNPAAPKSVNPHLPEMLNFIVAKALAKGLDARYQNAKDMADDLRECKNQLLQKPGEAMVTQLVAEPLRENPAYIIRDQDAKTLPLARVAPPSGPLEDDREEGPPTLGISKSFDSIGATMRLAAMTGMAKELEAYASTQKLAQYSGSGPKTTDQDTTVELKAPTPAAPQKNSSAESFNRLDTPAPPARGNKLIWVTIAILALIILAAVFIR